MNTRSANSSFKNRPAVLIHLALIVAMLALAVTVIGPTSVTVKAQGGTPAATEAAAFAAKCPVSPKAKITWFSPRGTLEVMDDYPLWVAKKLGYFDQMGIDVDLQPGPLGGANLMSLIVEKKADVGFPSPGVLTAAIDAGIPVIIPWEMSPGQVFDFAVRADSDIKSVKDLAGKTISLGSAGWSPVVDPILAEAGVDPKSVKYVEAGQQWGQMVDQGKADAALAWEGLRAQWTSIGLKVRFLIGSDFSKDPSNGYAVRAADLQDPALKNGLACFFRGVAMALEFSRVNPLAAAQITYEQFPALRDQMKPDLALESMRQLAWLYNQSNKAGNGFGYSDLANWQSYLDRIFKLGQTKKQLKTEEVVTNELVKTANDFDHAKVDADAKAYAVGDAWKDLKLQSPIE